MKSILIPTDFSATSNHALSHFLEMFKESVEEFNVTLLNTYVVPDVDSANAIKMNDLIKKKSLDKLIAAKVKMKELQASHDMKLNIEIITHMGSVVNVIPELLKNTEFDLLIMGKNGGDFIQRISNSLNESHSKCPLLVVYQPQNS